MTHDRLVINLDLLQKSANDDSYNSCSLIDLDAFLSCLKNTPELKSPDIECRFSKFVLDIKTALAEQIPLDNIELVIQSCYKPQSREMKHVFKFNINPSKC